ncbi:hypothetical protein F7731_07980 [Cytobacillus depressus]|uniref:RNA polymerase subunit sigma n=1 Tax=Cytobacillus depressus TaxID=1602942 RepID=A0A6L3V865_9BACI|nr:hypothetical protein [Cytobacillus depressus]KAB2337536.1 hypothetical protein F7731_07980 [Cytobacillus depressus]
MSLKSIEMQVALPRTVEVGKIQEQLQQRGQNIQDFANESTYKEEKKKRDSVIKNEHKANVKFTNEDGSDRSSNYDGNHPPKKKKRNDVNKEMHPYKGNVIDYSG